MVKWLANQSSNAAAEDRFPGGDNMNLLVNSDIIESSVKNQ